MTFQPIKKNSKITSPDLKPFDLGQLSVRPFTGGSKLCLTRWQSGVYTFELVIRLVTIIFK